MVGTETKPATTIEDGRVLRDALRECRRISKKRQGRYTFDSILVSVFRGEVTLMASDGRQLSVFHVHGSGRDVSDHRLIHRDDAPGLVKVLGRKRPATVTIDGDTITIESGGEVASAMSKRNSEDRGFPNIDGILNPGPISVTVDDAGGLSEIMANVTPPEGQDGVALDILKGTYGSIQIDGQALMADASEAIRIGVNPKRLCDALRPIKGEVTLRFATPNSPIIIEHDDGHRCYRHALMPVALPL